MNKQRRINKWINAIAIYITGIGIAEIILAMFLMGSYMSDTVRCILFISLFILVGLAYILANDNYKDANDE